MANLNDTNGNGVPDYQETNITQNHLGRNEVDLMKLVIRPRDAGLNLSGNVTLRQISGNSIKLWSSPVKLSGTEVSLPMTVDAIDLPMTLYVEALEPSSTARDIVLEADFAGKTDKVSATAVWVGIEKIYHKNDDQIDMQLLSEFGCVESLLNFNYDDDDNTYFGLGRPVSVVQFQGHPNNQTVIQQKARILFQWQLVPANAYNLIRIDGTRQRHTNNWRLDLDLTSGPDCKFNHTTTPFPFNKTPIPENNELPNDDSSTGCIDEITNDGVFLTWDAPGIVINQEFLEGDSFPRFLGYGNDKTNFLEWVRLAPSYTPRIYFNPPGVRGGELIGSRASNKISWSYGRYSTKDNEFMLEVNTAPYALNHVRVNQMPDDHNYYPIEYQITQMDHSYTLGTYSAAIFNNHGDEKSIILSRLSADENGYCIVIEESIILDDIPVEDSVYELPFLNHKIEITETENFDMLFLNWHTFYSTNKMHDFHHDIHLINLDH